MITHWRSPVPATSLQLDGFNDLPGMKCSLVISFATPSGEWQRLEFLFSNVLAYKCTFEPCKTEAMVETAYGKLVDIGSSEWLVEATKLAVSYPEFPAPRHLRICFDEDPCYDFLCGSFEIRTDPA